MKKYCILILLIICLVGCESSYYTDGIINYREVGNEYIITGLTEIGMEQEYIIVPSSINGLNVLLGVIHSGFHELNVGNVKKIFVSYEINRWEHNGAHVRGVKTFIFANTIGSQNSDYNDLYVSSWLYNNLNYGKKGEVITEKNKLSYYDAVTFFGYVHISNVSYHYNYPYAPNQGYYWLDDYDYGEKISIIPPVPTREGYTFGGWYKETECINEWIFDVDTLPEISYDDKNEVVFQETELYAKWIMC